MDSLGDPVGCASGTGGLVNRTGAEKTPNIAEITVFEDRVEVELEIYIGDLKTFGTLIPDDWLKDLKVDRPTRAERLKRFSEQGLRLVTATGETLQAEPRLRQDPVSPFAGMVNPIVTHLTIEPEGLR